MSFNVLVLYLPVFVWDPSWPPAQLVPVKLGTASAETAYLIVVIVTNCRWFWVCAFFCLCHLPVTRYLRICLQTRELQWLLITIFVWKMPNTIISGGDRLLWNYTGQGYQQYNIYIYIYRNAMRIAHYEEGGEGREWGALKWNISWAGNTTSHSQAGLWKYHIVEIELWLSNYLWIIGCNMKTTINLCSNSYDIILNTFNSSWIEFLNLSNRHLSIFIYSSQLVNPYFVNNCFFRFSSQRIFLVAFS